jgi:hypothetical protein
VTPERHRVVLRDGVELADSLALALGFLEAYAVSGAPGPRPRSFDERDLRLANRGGARISAAQIAVILERRGRIERALREIQPDASLAARSVPWEPLARLFDGFGEIPGVGFSKATKALHPKRPALVPMLDSVVQAYLPPPAAGPFGERAIALVRSYKQDLDRNRAALRELKRELARRGYELTEVRLLDVLLWSLGSV